MTSKHLLTIAVLLLTSACSTPQRATHADQSDLLRKLWADRPQYNDVGIKEPLVKLPTVQLQVTPIWPEGVAGWKRATVAVSFLVGEDGSVVEARVLKSTDGRFNDAAVEAVKRWSFLPAEDRFGPAKAFMLVPVVFNGKSKPNKPVETTSLARPEIRESFPFAVTARSVSHG